MAYGHKTEHRLRVRKQDREPVQVPEIRLARPSDYDQIADVLDQWWGRPVLPALPRMFLDHFYSTSRIAEDQNGLAGFVVGFISPSEPSLAYLHFAGVRPDQRRHGLACRLYQEFAENARRHGCRELRAITSPANTDSIRFHRRLGFTVSAPIQNYNGPGRAMVIFRQLLDD